MTRLVAALPILLFAGLATLFYIQLYAGDPSEIPSALIGRKAPEFVLPPVEGLMSGSTQVPGLATADLKGKVTLVNVFASWCDPCRDEHPQLMALSTDKRFSIMGLNYKDEPANAVHFLKELGNPYFAVGADRSGRVGIDWGVYGVPETFVVAADGTIVFKKIGPIMPEDVDKVMRPAIERALGMPAFE